MQHLVDWLLDLFFPIRCIHCGKFGFYLCRPCLNSIPIRSGSECVGCKRPIRAGITCIICKRQFALDQLLIAADYKHPVIKKAVKALKYRFIPDLAEPLGDLLQKYVRNLSKTKNINTLAGNPVIASVPLAVRRENWRGFNQADLLARRLADHFLITYVACLKRMRETPSQAELEERGNRRQNMADAFACNNPPVIAGKTVILVDDICTTGATLDACALALKQKGATKVIALVIARG